MGMAQNHPAYEMAPKTRSSAGMEIILEYTIKKLAHLTGITTRTLRYYHEIGLLHPCRLSSSGYRIYGEQEVDVLQQILFYRELGFPLTDIKVLLTNPDFNLLGSLKSHLSALIEQRNRLELLITNVNKTILKEEGKITMTDQEKFEGFKTSLIAENEETYGEELQRNYGKDTIKESNAKLMHLTKEEYDAMESLGLKIKKGLEEAVAAKEPANGPVGQLLAALHKEWLSYTWPSYSGEAHAGLAQMYTEDERFRIYYDKNLNGCAVFLRDAVLFYVDTL